MGKASLTPLELGTSLCSSVDFWTAFQRAAGSSCDPDPRRRWKAPGAPISFLTLPSHPWDFQLYTSCHLLASPSWSFHLLPGAPLVSPLVFASLSVFPSPSWCFHLIPGAWTSAFLFPFHHSHLHLPIPVCISPFLFASLHSCFHLPIPVSLSPFLFALHHSCFHPCQCPSPKMPLAAGTNELLSLLSTESPDFGIYGCLRRFEPLQELP